MREKLTVIKVGGKIVEEEATLRQLLNDFAAIDGHKVLVHGGGRSATKIAAQLGIESKMVNGRRITDAETLKVVTMVYGGLVNKNIVAGLQARGVNALGLTGADMNVIRSVKRPVKEVDYGFVGDVEQVDATLLSDLIHKGVVPVMAPLTHDGHGNMLNTNATHQRMSFIPANNRYVGPYNAESSADLLNALGGQPYPGTEGNTALTNETTPASLVFTGTRMNKPITQIRELENGDIVLKYMPKGRLEAPVVETAVEVASNSFKFSWSPSENATFYTVKVYGISGDGQWTEHPVFIADSLSGTSCTVLLDDTSHQSYAYGVSALDDEYEDSEFSDYGYVRLTADAVRQVGTEEDANVEVYSLHGVLLARSREAMSNLVPGIYVLRAEGKAVKVVIK